jgi:hypothetical protein
VDARLTFTPHGNWLHSDCGRYRVSRMELWQGRVYGAYVWDDPRDWGPTLINNFHSSRAATKACETHSNTTGVNS